MWKVARRFAVLTLALFLLATSISLLGNPPPPRKQLVEERDTATVLKVQPETAVVLTVPREVPVQEPTTLVTPALPPEEAVFVAHRQCVKHKLAQASTELIWDRSAAIVNECASKTTKLNERLRLLPLRNRDETKYVLDVFPKLKSGEECNVVTLGIGTDIEAEEQLMKRLPATCRFHGADPGEAENRDLFSKLGSFYPYAVAATSGVHKASIFDPKSGGYYFTNISHLDILTFLREKAKVHTIDYLWMDNEFAEYDMVQYFLPGDLMDQNNITVCQWNCEFHGNGPKWKYAEFFLKNLDSGRFLPIQFLKIDHIRTTFINVRDEICLRRYITP